MTAKLAEIRKGYASAYNLATVMNYIASLVYIIAVGIMLIGGAVVADAPSSAMGTMVLGGTFFMSAILFIMGLIVQGLAAALRAVADTAVNTARVLTP